MKYLAIISILFVTTKLYAQQKVINDSVNVRIHNKGRFYLKKYIITIGDRKYIFYDVMKNKYSNYQKLPYIFTLNQTEVQIVRKRLLNYDDWEDLMEMPIDYVGEKRITDGYVTVDVVTKRKSGKLVVISNVITQ